SPGHHFRLLKYLILADNSPFMKSYLLWALFSSTLFVLGSCQKEYSTENGGTPSAGSLQKDGIGECLPKNVIGIYEVGSTLVGTDNYIEVQVDVTAEGSYAITTDLVNGIRFSASGYFTNTGLITDKLRGTGTDRKS